MSTTNEILREIIKGEGLSYAEASARLGFKSRTSLSAKLNRTITIDFLYGVCQYAGYEIKLRKGKNTFLISKSEDESNTKEILEKMLEKENISQASLSKQMGYASKLMVAGRKRYGITIDFLYKVGKHLGYEMVVKKKGKEYIITKD